MGKLISSLAASCRITNREAVLYLALSAAGWIFMAHAYLYGSGLGVAVPRYAGF